MDSIALYELYPGDVIRLSTTGAPRTVTDIEDKSPDSELATLTLEPGGTLTTTRETHVTPLSLPRTVKTPCARCHQDFTTELDLAAHGIPQGGLCQKCDQATGGGTRTFVITI